jgi:ABC-type antimicrobial peptide transport system permease subunit
VPRDVDLEVVGVAGNVALRTLGEEPRPAFYLPFTQWYQGERTLHVRAGDPGRALNAIRAAAGATDGDLPLFNVKTMEEHVGGSLFAARAAGIAVGAFGLLTLALAALGLHGLASFSVRSRTREIAVRLAVGATGNDIVRLVIWEGLKPVSCGLAAGAVLAAVLANAFRRFLFGGSAADPAAWNFAVATLLLAAGAGAFFPARRAAALAPAPVLRRGE